jgi:hypothetical protein
MAAPYPDMTPGPPTKGILDTSYQSLPSDARKGGSWEDWIPGGGPSTYVPPTFSGLPTRVGTEMAETYRDTPPIITPEAQETVANTGWLGRYVASPLISASNFVGKEGAALGAGGLAAFSELFGGGDPEKVRDAHILPQILPVAGAMESVAGRYPGPAVPSEPSYIGPLKPVDMQYTPTTAPGPVGPLYPPEALPTNTPADVLKIYQGQRAAAAAGDFQLKPQFTDDFVASLDKYQPQSPTAQATAPTTHPVTALVDDLRKSASAPFTDIRSIQEVDKQIQDAISGQYGTNGLSPAGVQMRQILRDFRDRYENIPDDQMSGSPQAIQDSATARNTYAAYSRMKELQGVVDSTEGNPNRATLVASRVNGFLNDPENVRGWNPEEISAARTAANSGFIQEWLRAEGSRLVGVGAAVTLPGLGKLLGVPAQVALSYAVRNAAETARLAQVQKAMGILGQRVEQPGTVPAQPPPYMPPRALPTGARYAPLTGLLGQTQDQDRQGTILPSLW